MKKCPFCAEEIQLEAIKCRHCGEFLDCSVRPKKEARPWYFRDGTVISAILMLMAFALPLVWFNSYYSRRNKIIITVIVGILTYVIGAATAQALKQLGAYYQQMM